MGRNLIQRCVVKSLIGDRIDDGEAITQHIFPFLPFELTFGLNPECKPKMTPLCSVCLAVLLGSLALARVDGAPRTERLGAHLETDEVRSEVLVK